MKQGDLTLSNEVAHLRAQVTYLEAQIAERDRAADDLTAAHSRASGEAARFSEEVAELRAHVTRLELQIAERDRAAIDLAAEQSEAAADTKRHRAALDGVLQSTPWRLASALKSVSRFFPATARQTVRDRLRPAFGLSDLPISEAPSRASLFQAESADKPLPKGARKLIRNSGLFDPGWYSTHYTDVAALGIDPFVHFIRIGLQQNRNPNALFDAQWYRRAYPDVAADGINPLLHFIQWGAAEGRRPSPAFSCTWYIDQYPEVQALGENPLSHYLRLGKEMGWLPLDPNAAYRAHVLSENQLFALEASELELHARSLIFPVRFLIFIEGTDLKARQQTEKSLEIQINKNYLVINTTYTLEFDLNCDHNCVDFFVWLKAGDELSPRALYEFSSLINANISLDMVYPDSDDITPDGRLNPFFKPDWSPDYLEAMNYIGSSACFRASASVQLLQQATSIYDFLLLFTEQPVQVAHIRKVLHHGRQIADAHLPADGVVGDLGALERRIQRTGRVVREAAPIGPGLGGYDVKLKLQTHPLVTLIILTSGQTMIRDNERIDFLDNCIRAIAERSTYENLEIIIVDDGEIKEEQRRSFKGREYKVVTCTNGRSNISKKVNLGARASKGDLLLLVDETVEVASPDWIERMLEHFEKPHVGVVGAKLLHPDYTIKSAGVVLKDCVPVDAGRGQPRDAFGYFLSTRVARNFTAISGACMMTRTDAFREVGGFQEALPQSCNDTDYCLRIGMLGLTIVYSPHAELIQYPPSVNNEDHGLADIEYFDHFWGSSLNCDRFDNLDCVEANPAARL
jgi:O-antigen biosynthesis protein